MPTKALTPIQQFVLRDLRQNADNLKNGLDNDRTRVLLRRAPEVILDILNDLGKVSSTAKLLLLESEDDDDGEPARETPAISFAERKLTDFTPLHYVDRTPVTSPGDTPPPGYTEPNESEAGGGEPPPTPLPGRGAEASRLTNAGRETTGRYTDGVWTGIHPRQWTECRFCGTRRHASEARDEKWPALNRCPGPHTPEQEARAAEAEDLAKNLTPPRPALAEHVVAAVRESYPYPVDDSGVVQSGPMTGLSLNDKVTCRRCRMSLRVATTGKWAERNLCRQCGLLMDRINARLAAAAAAPAPPEAVVAEPETVVPSHPMAGRGARYLNAGIWNGMWPKQNTTCRFPGCERKLRIHQAKAEGWPEVDLCPLHSTPPPTTPPEPEKEEAPAASSPAAVPAPVVTAPALTRCTGCGNQETQEWASTHWPLPDFCDQCDLKAAPEAPRCAVCHEREPEKGVLLCKICSAQEVQRATVAYIESMGVTLEEIVPKPVTPPVSAVTEAPEAFSRKRPRPIGSAANWKEKREERYFHNTKKAH